MYGTWALSVIVSKASRRMPPHKVISNLSVNVDNHFLHSRGNFINLYKKQENVSNTHETVRGLRLPLSSDHKLINF